MKGTFAFGRHLWIPMFVMLTLSSNSSTGCPQTEPPCCDRSAAAPGEFTDKSLYQTESRWTTDTGQQMRLAALKGRPQIIVMFFANCRSACPVLVHDLQRIEASLNENERSRVGFTLVTIDPRRDTPEALARYRANRSLATNTWTLLHGAPADIQELAALLGVRYKEQTNGQFAHSNLITVLNRQGEIVHQLAGLGQDVEGTIRVIKGLIASPPDSASP